MLLFQLLVIVLDKAPNNRRARVERVNGKLVTGLKSAESFSIDQQDTFEHPVLAHQIFGRGHLVLRGLVSLALRVVACR